MCTRCASAMQLQQIPGLSLPKFNWNQPWTNHKAENRSWIDDLESAGSVEKLLDIFLHNDIPDYSPVREIMSREFETICPNWILEWIRNGTKPPTSGVVGWVDERGAEGSRGDTGLVSVTELYSLLSRLVRGSLSNPSTPHCDSSSPPT